LFIVPFISFLFLKKYPPIGQLGVAANNSNAVWNTLTPENEEDCGYI